MPLKGLLELATPEYRDRHLFTARLRFAIFLGFWFLYIYFYHGVLGQLKVLSFIFAGSFLLTTISYFWIIKNRFIFVSVVSEIIADLVTITAVIYITEGPYSDFFTLYLFYIFITGVFYNYLLALFIAVGCGLFYGAFLLLCQYGIIPPLIIDWGEQIPSETHSPQYHFFFWAIFSVLVVYGVKVASYFSQKRERQLEARNKELTALAQMSSTIRSTISVQKVLEQILQGLEAGLDLVLSVLVLFDKETKKIKLLFPQEHPIVKKILQVMGPDVSRYSLATGVVENTALQAILQHKIIYRKDLEEILIGLKPPMPKEEIQKIQEGIGFHKLVGVPLVAEEELIGALLGFTRSGFVDEQTVKTLEAFANQAALILEAALLIQKLRDANVRLQEANKVKTEFLAAMSHELRTPLTAIIGFSELLIEGVMGKLTKEQEDNLREVLNNGAILLDMINNLLDMAKMEVGKMTLEIGPFDFKELVVRLKQTLDSLVKRKKQRLELRFSDNIPPIVADEKKIQQVILNLFSNAIKFTPERGKIVVSLKHYNGENLREEVSWADRLPKEKKYPKGVFELSVTDTGIGIEKDKLNMIFEMFSQVDSSVTRSFGGTGLGLALAKQFTELHHGAIWAESELGRGTKFTIVLPAIVLP